MAQPCRTYPIAGTKNLECHGRRSGKKRKRNPRDGASFNRPGIATNLATEVPLQKRAKEIDRANRGHDSGVDSLGIANLSRPL